MNPHQHSAAKTRRHILTAGIGSLLAALALPLGSPSARAANVFWDTNGNTGGAGATPTGIWDNGVTANFTTDLNGAITTTTRANSTTGADTVTFSAGTDAVNPYTITVSGTVGAGGLIFEEGTVTLSGTATPALSLGTGGIVVNSTVAGAVTLDSTLGSVQLVGNQNWTNSSAQNLVIGAGVTTGGSNQTLTINGAGAGVTVLNGDLTNNGAGVLSLTKSAAGTLTLAGNNSYTGATTLSTGTINVNSTTAFGTPASTVAINGVTLDNTSGSAKTLANNNAFTLGGNNIFTGTNDLNLGTGAMSLNGATRTWTVNGGTLTVGGNLTGGSAAIGLTKAGAGTLKLAGAANSTIGTLTVNGGTVDLGTDLGLSGGTIVGGSGGTINTSGGKIVLNVAAGDFGVANGGTLTVNAVIANGTSGAIDFWNTSSGTGIVVLNAANTFDGITNLQSGVVTVSTIGNSGVAGNLGRNGTFNIGAATSTATLKYTGTVETNDRVINLSGTTGGAIIDQSGTGLLKFNGNVTAPGVAATDQRKTLTLQGSTTGTGEIAGSIVNSTLGTAGQLTTTVFKTGTGTWTLSGANTYTGATIVRQGQLTLSGSAKTNTGAQILVVDNNAASTTNARLNISSDVTALQMFIGDRASVGQTGAVYHTAGTVTLTQAAGVDNLRIGSTANGWGYYNLSGTGTLILNEVGVGAHLAGTVGVMEMSGGTLTDAGWLAIGHGTGIGSGLLNMSGGSITFGAAASARLALNFATTVGGISILNVGGGAGTPTITGASTATATRGLNLAEANVAGTAGIANLLTNGTLTVSEVSATGGANPTALLNFNGGTLKATATNTGASFLTSANVDRVDVYGLGGTIDNSGTAITIGRPLTAPTGLGVNTIPVTVGGTGFVGAPLLKITGGTGDGATAVANMVDDGTGAGTLKIGSITITSPGVYSVAPTTVTLFGGNPGGTAVALGALTTTANTNSNGGITFQSTGGTGTTTLTGVNTYTGGTTVNSGTLVLGHATDTLLNTGAVNVNGGTLSIGGNSDTVGAVTLTTGTIDGSTGVLTGSSYDVRSGTVSAILNGSGSTLTKSTAGTVTLSKANTYTGATAINAGTLAVTGSLASGSAVAVNAGGTLAGTTTAGGSSTVAGSVTVAGGASTRGTISLVNGSLGTLNTGALTVGGVSGDYSQLNFDLFTAGLTTTADKIASTGVFTIDTGGSNITITLAGGTPNSGTYDLLTFTSGAGAGYSIGTGTTVNGLTLTNPTLTFGVTGSLDVTSTAVRLAVTASAAPGTAYWLGDQGSTWAANNGTFGNFSTVKAGTSPVTALPGATTDLFFAATPSINSATLTNTLGQDFSIKSLTFEGDTSVSNISGASVLTIGTGGITLASGNGGATLGMTTLNLLAPQTWANASSNDLTVSANVTGSSGNTLAINNTSTGKTVLSGANSTYAGATAVNNGILKAGSTGGLSANSAYTLANTAGVTLDITGFNSSVGSLAGGGTTGGNVTLGAATLTAGTDNSGTTYAGAISGTGGFTKAGTGAMILSGTNAYTGATTINGGTLTASGGSAIADTSAVVLADTAGAIFNLANSETIGSLAGGGTTGGNVTLGASSLTTGGNNTTTTYSGVLSGAGSLTKNGTGSMTLGGLNTFTGNIAIDNGTITAGTGIAGNIAASIASNLGDIGTAVSRSITINNGGILSLTGGNVLGTGGSTGTHSGVTLVVNSGGVFQTGLNAAGAGWWNKIGAVNLNGGTIRVGSGANTTSFQALALIGTVTVGGSTVSTIDNLGSSNNASNGIHLGQNATAGQMITFDVADVTGDSVSDLNVSAKLLNTSSNLVASGLLKSGLGTMTLSGASTYTGNVLVSSGTLNAAFVNVGTPTSGSLGNAQTSGRTVTVNSGATLAFTGNDILGNQTAVAASLPSFIINGAMSTVRYNQIGALTLNGATLTSNNVVDSGNYQNFQFLGNVTVTGSAASSINSTSAANFNGNHLGTATTFNVADVTGDANTDLSVSAPFRNQSGNYATAAGALVKSGAGTMNLSGASSYTGDTTINGGTLVANLANNTPNPVTSALGNPQTAHNITVNSSGTLNFAQGDTFGGADSVVVATLVINAGGLVTNTVGNFTTLGPVTLNGGTLTTAGGAAAGYQSYSLGGNVAVGGSAASAISVTGGGNAFNGFHLGTNTTFTVADATSSAASDLVVSVPLIDRNATLTGVGGLTKSGPGTMSLAASNTYTGPTTVTGGTLEIGGSINATSSVSVGSGTLLLSGGSEKVANVDTSLTNGTVAFADGGTGGFTETLDTLTLSGTSTLDFGSGTTNGNTLIFAGLAAGTVSALNGGTVSLNIWNWSFGAGGAVDTDLTNSGTEQDRLLFAASTGLDSVGLGQISFYSGENSDFLGTGSQITFTGGGFEIVPIPEPSTTGLIGAAALLGLVGFRERRRFLGLRSQWVRRQASLL